MASAGCERIRHRLDSSDAGGRVPGSVVALGAAGSETSMGTAAGSRTPKWPLLDMGGKRHARRASPKADASMPEMPERC